MALCPMPKPTSTAFLIESDWEFGVAPELNVRNAAIAEEVDDEALRTHKNVLKHDPIFQDNNYGLGVSPSSSGCNEVFAEQVTDPAAIFVDSWEVGVSSQPNARIEVHDGQQATKETFPADELEFETDSVGAFQKNSNSRVSTPLSVPDKVVDVLAEPLVANKVLLEDKPVLENIAVGITQQNSYRIEVIAEEVADEALRTHKNILEHDPIFQDNHYGLVVSPSSSGCNVVFAEQVADPAAIFLDNWEVGVSSQPNARNEVHAGQQATKETFPTDELEFEIDSVGAFQKNNSSRVSTPLSVPDKVVVVLAEPLVAIKVLREFGVAPALNARNEATAEEVSDEALRTHKNVPEDDPIFQENNYGLGVSPSSSGRNGVFAAKVADPAAIFLDNWEVGVSSQPNARNEVHTGQQATKKAFPTDELEFENDSVGAFQKNSNRVSTPLSVPEKIFDVLAEPLVANKVLWEFGVAPALNVRNEAFAEEVADEALRTHKNVLEDDPIFQENNYGLGVSTSSSGRNGVFAEQVADATFLTDKLVFEDDPETIFRDTWEVGVSCSPSARFQVLAEHQATSEDERVNKDDPLEVLLVESDWKVVDSLLPSAHNEVTAKQIADEAHFLTKPVFEDDRMTISRDSWEDGVSCSPSARFQVLAEHQATSEDERVNKDDSVEVLLVESDWKVGDSHLPSAHNEVTAKQIADEAHLLTKPVFEDDRMTISRESWEDGVSCSPRTRNEFVFERQATNEIVTDKREHKDNPVAIFLDSWEVGVSSQPNARSEIHVGQQTTKEAFPTDELEFETDSVEAFQKNSNRVSTPLSVPDKVVDVLAEPLLASKVLQEDKPILENITIGIPQQNSYRISTPPKDRDEVRKALAERYLANEAFLQDKLIFENDAAEIVQESNNGVSPPPSARDQVREALAEQEITYEALLTDKEERLKELEAQLKKLSLAPPKPSPSKHKAEEDKVLSTVLAKYEQAMSGYIQKIDELQQKLNEADREKVRVIKERDTAWEDLRNVESAFSDVHKKYERVKGILENHRQNEEILKQRDTEMLEKIANRDEKIQELKDKVKANLELMYVTYERKQKSLETDVARLRAQLRKAEMKVGSLEQDVEQKTKETVKLSALCDELINEKLK